MPASAASDNGISPIPVTIAVAGQSRTEREEPEPLEKTKDAKDPSGQPVQAEDDTVYPRGSAFWAVYSGLLMAIFMIGYDSSCVATIIPVITDEFHSSDEVGWYGTAYLISSASTIIAYGKIYKYYSTKPVYLIALCVYLVGSIVCATAPSSLAFILGRAVTGLGSSGMIAGSKVLIIRMLPLHRRPLFQGYVAGVESVAIAIGPLVGGAVALAASWRAVFYISIPVGVINGGLLLIFGKMPGNPTAEDISRREQLRALDLPSIGLLIPCVVCLVLGFSWAGAQYEWRNYRIILTLTLAGVSALVFASVQVYKKDAATIPPRIIAQRTIAFSSLFAFCNSACLFVLTYYLPIYFQAISGANTLTSGVMTLPLVGGLIIGTLGAGHLTTAIGYYTPSMIASSVLASVGSGLISTLSAPPRVPTWVAFQLFAGLGCGLGFQQPYVAAQKVIVKPDVPTALVIVGFMQRLGNIVCLGAAQNVFTSRLIANVAMSVPNIDPKLVLNTGATSLRTSVREAQRAAVLKAYSTTLDQVFYIAVALSCLAMVGALGTEWKSVKEQTPTAMESATVANQAEEKTQ